MTKEQVYQQQMEELGIWREIFLPELRTLCRCERELTRAEKAWSNTAPPGGKPSFLDDHYPVIEKLRSEILQHRQALGLTPQSFRKLTGVNAGGDTPEQKDLISSKLDQIAERVSGYDVPGFAVGINPEDIHIDDENRFENVVIPNKPEVRVWLEDVDPRQDPFAGIPAADEAAAISDMIDRQDAAKISHGMDEDLAAAVAEDMG